MRLSFEGRGEDSLQVLAVGAHPDDIELGCGGLLLQLAADPTARVRSLVLTGAAERAAEARSAARAFGAGPAAGDDGPVLDRALPDGHLPAHWSEVKQALEQVAGAGRFDLVLAPRLDDAHQDHRTVAEIVPTVFRSALVLGYEIHKSDGDRGRCSVLVPLGERELERKWRLLDEHFPSQRQRAWWDREVVAGLARLRGVEAGSRYAEGFTCNRLVVSVGPGPGC